ncbi:MAG TPA: DUF4339 domain-containing protein [Verrucomicrobiae bacterium]|nr:DUF4339 domain-containing protein [Verrucomicrobiae bacterium]
MNWYYVSGNEQKGPVEPSDFERLIQSGDINASTLVWREGMPDWKAYGEINGGAPPLPSIASRGVICSVCQQSFPLEQTIRLDNSFVCAACKPIALQRMREGVSNNAAEQIRKDHIKHEASVKSVGFLYFLAAAFLLLAGTGGVLTGDGPSIAVGLVLACFGILQIWVGIGLRQLKSWARIPTAVLSGIGLLGFPLGTIINGYILYLVLCQKGRTVFSDEYKRVIEQTPHIKYKTSIIVWIFLGLLLVLIGLGFFAVLFGARR